MTDAIIMKRILGGLVMIGGIFCLGEGPGHAAPSPTLLSYQGRLQAGGTNYSGPGFFKFALVRPSADSPRAARAVLEVLDGQVVGVHLTDPGQGYTVPPAVQVEDPTGEGAQLAAILGGDRVLTIDLLSGGQGYSPDPALVIEPPRAPPLVETLWSNDQTSAGGAAPLASVPVPVKDGLFQVTLGDSRLANMALLPAELLAQTNLHLRLWVRSEEGEFHQLQPDQPVYAPGFAQLAGGLPDQAVGSNTLQDQSVTALKLAPHAVTRLALEEGAVTLEALDPAIVQRLRDAVGRVRFELFDDFSRPDTTNGWVGSSSPTGHRYLLDGPHLLTPAKGLGRIEEGYLVVDPAPEVPTNGNVYLKTVFQASPGRIGMRVQQRPGNGGSLMSSATFSASSTPDWSTRLVHLRCGGDGCVLSISTNGVGNSSWMNVLALPWSVTNGQHFTMEMEYLEQDTLLIRVGLTNLVVHHPMISDAWGPYVFYQTGGATRFLNTTMAIDAIWAASPVVRWPHFGADFQLATNGPPPRRAEQLPPTLSISTNLIAARPRSSQPDALLDQILILDGNDSILKRVRLQDVFEPRLTNAMNLSLADFKPPGEGLPAATLSDAAGPRRLLFAETTDQAVEFQQIAPPDLGQVRSLRVLYEVPQAEVGQAIFACEAVATGPGETVRVIQSSDRLSIGLVPVPTRAGQLGQFRLDLSGWNLGPGQLMQLRLRRNAGNPLDSVEGDVGVVGIAIEYLGR